MLRFLRPKTTYKDVYGKTIRYKDTVKVVGTERTYKVVRTKRIGENFYFLDNGVACASLQILTKRGWLEII